MATTRTSCSVTSCRRASEQAFPSNFSADGPTVDIRDVLHPTLSYDHRLIDGADAAHYLMAVKAIVETAAFADELP